jgi:phosphoglycolate phosphatase-like HAD superfamily hydrolase
MDKRDLELVIFDFDGVLVTGNKVICYVAYCYFLRELGVNPAVFFKNYPEFKKWWVSEWRENLRKLGIADEFSINFSHEKFYEFYNIHIRLLGWVAEFIGQAKNEYTLSIMTNRHRSMVYPFIPSLVSSFRMIVGCEDVARLKPDPEGINLILAETSIKPEKALMIGDSAMDIFAGKNAGVRTAAVGWGLDDIKDLILLEPDFVFEKPEDMINFLL